MKSYVVIGLGRFGTELATRLYARGEEVMVIDTNDQLIDKIADKVTRAVAADARDLDVLTKLGVENFEHAVVAVGSDLASSALITMNLKSLNVPYILCKAHDDTYREILERLGADKVIIPEREVADKLALGMTQAGVMEYIELSQEFGIVEMEPIAEWVGKTIRELELRTRYGVNVIAVRGEGDAIKIPPDIDTPIPEDVVMVMLGKYEMFESLKKK
ncbi:TrkA family potassium uptake protein [Clostridiales bacterium FE2011]|jgi:trk system potassium uptake protein TrkA|nr:TrkA family potassium uptake protein [Clostridiales bacterium FE2011]QTE74623.1 TrkA family potassium uptake protein [Clostridiales bacterium FE2010]